MKTNKNKIPKEDIFFCRIDEAVLRFGFSRSYIRTLISEKKIPSFLPSPKVLLLRVSDLISYVESSSVEIDE